LDLFADNPYVLSAIITRKTGKNAWDYAKKKLFGPLGVLTERWRDSDAQGSRKIRKADIRAEPCQLCRDWV